MDDSDFYTSGSYDKVAISAQKGRIARLFHARPEARISTEEKYSRVLEVGALTGQHLPFVKHQFDEWHLLDRLDTDSNFGDPRVSFTKGDVEDLPFDDEYFDRVMSTCVLHHLSNPYLALTEMRRVTKVGGLVTIFLPVHPGLPYDLAWELTTVMRAKKLGLENEARKAMALGHKNHYASLIWQVNDVFNNDQREESYWPLGVHIARINMFHTIQFRKVAS